MNLEIFNLVKGRFTPEMITGAASALNESEADISAAINGFVPLVLAGLANNSEDLAILDAIKSDINTVAIDSLSDEGPASVLIDTILNATLGDHQQKAVAVVSSIAEIGHKASKTLLRAVTRVVIATVNNFVLLHNLDLQSISALLAEQKETASIFIPGELSSESVGLNQWFEKRVKPEPSVGRGKKKKYGGGILWKVLIPVFLLGLSLFLANLGSDKERAISTLWSKIFNTSAAKHKVEEYELDGKIFKLDAETFEGRMLYFLKSGGYENARADVVLQDMWYDLDNVIFEDTSSDKLIPDSEEQLSHLVSILREFPHAKIKVGAFTDKTDDEPANIRISQERAGFIMQYLIQKGVGGQVVESEGYGSRYGTRPATAPEEERKIDRRVAVRFIKK